MGRLPVGEGACDEGGIGGVGPYEGDIGDELEGGGRT